MHVTSSMTLMGDYGKLERVLMLELGLSQQFGKDG